MTQEQLEIRISAINQELTRTKANYLRLEGHLTESQHWLKSLIATSNESEVNDNECEESKLETDIPQ